MISCFLKDQFNKKKLVDLKFPSEAIPHLQLQFSPKVLRVFTTGSITAYFILWSKVCLSNDTLGIILGQKGTHAFLFWRPLPLAHTYCTFVPPDILTVHCYNSSGPILTPPGFRLEQNVPVVNGLLETSWLEELINNAAESSWTLGMVKRNICPQGGGLVRPRRQNDWLAPSGQRATNTSIAWGSQVRGPAVWISPAGL